MSSVNFDNPWLLLIALPLIALVAVPAFLSVGKDNRNVHNVTSSILHVLIAIFVAFSAAGTSIKSIMTETDVYVVADLSYSTRNNLDKIDEYIENLADDLPLNTKLCVVCFGGGQPVIHTPLGETPRSVRESVGKVDETSTDIVGALEYTGKIFKEGVIKRIVLITDAKESDQSDKNALKRAVDTLHASKVYVDAIYLDSNRAADAKEVQITDVDYADKVYQGSVATANVAIESTVETRAELEITRNGEFFTRQPIELGVGTKSIPIYLPTDELGEYAYSVELTECEIDESQRNNVATFKQTVASQPVTLFITESTADEKLAKEIYGDAYEQSVTLKYVDEEIPYTVAQLCQYDEIVLSNVDVTKINNYEMFIESLDVVVSLLGKSLVGLGNLGIQNSTDSALLRLSNMLPVRYGSPISEQRMYTIVFDMSNSMEQIGKMSVAKNAAKQLVDLLEDDDKVAIIGFHGKWEVKQVPVDASKRESIKEVIDNIEGEHGTVISGGLAGAQEALKEYAAEMRTQVFLITDGANNSGDWENANSVVEQMNREYGVTTSILGILSSQTGGRLQTLATYGKGEYWYVEDNTMLDEEVFSDISNELGEVMVDSYSLVNKELLFDSVLEGLPENMSFVKGYVASKAKPYANTVLTATHRIENMPSINVPLYSYWNYGNGKTSVYTSTFTGEWAEQWSSLDLDRQFFENVLETNTPAERIDAPFVSTVSRQSGGASLEIRPAQIKTGAEVSVTLRSPDGETTTVNNVVFDSSVYTCSFAMPSVGEYIAEITYSYKGESYTQAKPIHVFYLSEYDSFTTYDASPLYKMLGSKGTVSEDGQLNIENDENEVGIQIIELALPLMIVAVVLFMVDVLVRKLKWADIKGLFRKIKKGEKK